MAFDYSRLIGRMKKKSVTQAALAKEIGNSEATLSLKLNNKARFKQSEIAIICEKLCIPENEIGAYFFANEV